MMKINLGGLECLLNFSAYIYMILLNLTEIYWAYLGMELGVARSNKPKYKCMSIS
jgi:hypothetical protein